jgi:hypothetical protein
MMISRVPQATTVDTVPAAPASAGPFPVARWPSAPTPAHMTNAQPATSAITDEAPSPNNRLAARRVEETERGRVDEEAHPLAGDELGTKLDSGDALAGTRE